MVKMEAKKNLSKKSRLYFLFTLHTLNKGEKEILEIHNLFVLLKNSPIPQQFDIVTSTTDIFFFI